MEQQPMEEDPMYNIDQMTGMSAMAGAERMTTETVEVNLTVSKVEQEFQEIQSGLENFQGNGTSNDYFDQYCEP